MKKLIVLFFLIPFLFGGIQQKHKSVIAAKSVASAGSCSGNYGIEAEGTVANSTTAGRILIIRVPLSCSGSVSSISAFLKFAANSSSEIEFAIYDDNGSGTDPDSLLGNYGVFYDSGSSTSKWVVDSTISETISGDPTYIWVAIQFETTNTQYDFDSGGSYPTRSYNGSWGTWPSTWPTGSDSAGTLDYSIYITF